MEANAIEAVEAAQASVYIDATNVATKGKYFNFVRIFSRLICYFSNIFFTFLSRIVIKSTTGNHQAYRKITSFLASFYEKYIPLLAAVGHHVVKEP